jgi:hypothetical protein
MLATKEGVAAKADGGDVVLSLPAKAPDAIASVIEVKFSGALDVDRRLPGPTANGSFAFGADTADIHNSLRAHAKLEGKGNAAKITNWDNAEARVSWDFHAPKAGAFLVKANVGAGSGKLSLVLDSASVAAEVPASEATGNRTVELGKIEIPKAGAYTLELKPNKNAWKGFELSGLTLTPAQN